MVSTALPNATAKMLLSVPLWTAPAHVNQVGMGWTALLTAPVEPGVWDVIIPACVAMEELATP